MRKNILGLVALLLTFVPLSGFSGFFSGKADPGATEAVSEYFQLVDCRDGQHYVLGLNTVLSLYSLYALDLGPDYKASDYLELRKEDVSTVDTKNGIEKQYSWTYELNDIPARAMLVLDINDYYNNHAEKNKGWYEENFKMWGYVKLVNGKWKVDMPIKPQKPWFGHLNNDPLRSCAIFGL